MRIGLYKGRSLISRLIRWQTRSTYSHASLILPDNTVIEAWTGGVRWQRIHDGHTKGTVVDVFEPIGVFTAGIFNSLAVEQFARSQIGKGYDYLSVARFVTRTRGDRQARWFCSELVFQAYLAGGLRLLERIEPWAVSPALLRLSPWIRHIDTLII